MEIVAYVLSYVLFISVVVGFCCYLIDTWKENH